MDGAFLELDHISKTFPGVKALSDVHFDILPGEVHALVGENGAGKSTLIKIMSGVYQPDKGGVIRVNGKETNISGTIDAIRQGIAVIYQDFSLFGNLTAAENIGINGAIDKNRLVVNWKKMYQEAKKALEIVGADIDPSVTLGNLSVAKQQMVAIASAIAQDAKMIIMDEPTSSLSKTEIDKLFEIIGTLKKKNIAVMFVSHKLDEIFRVSDRITVFRDGRYISTAKSGEVNTDQLISMMVGRKVLDKNYANLEKKNGVALEVNRLTKEGNFKDISFRLFKGEVLGITGLVGAGRSEMAQAIFGINRADSGEILVDGEKVRINSPTDAMNAGIAYIPENRQTQGLIQDQTVESNIALPLLKHYTNRIGLVKRGNQRAFAEKWIDRLDVRPKNPELLAMQLSGGNQQKVVLAKWIAADARILIVDEPTNGVDIGAKAEIHSIIREIAAAGTSVILISSELPEILSVSDRILVMRRGRIAGEFVNKDVTQEMIMDKALVSNR